MKTPEEGLPIPPEITAKLREVRSKDRRVRWGIGFFRAIAIVVCAMLVAMLIDWVVVIFDPQWRWALTLTALGCAAAGILWWSLRPMFRRRSLTEIARDVDRAHPGLEERFSTLTEVSQSGDAPELRGSDAMLKKVAQQAAALSSSVNPEAVVPKIGFVRAMQFCATVIGLLLIFFAVDFSRAKILTQRFWMPGRDITLTQLQAKPGDAVIGKGETVNLDFLAAGKQPDTVKLFIQTESGRSETVLLKPLPGTNTAFHFARASIAEGFQYRARAGDGQTAWHTIGIAERPKLANAAIKVVPPAYSKLPTIEEKTLPHRLRVLEGSTMEVILQPDQPVENVVLKFNDGTAQVLQKSAHDDYRFTALLTNTVTFTPMFTNQYRLDNQPRQTSELLVYRDQAPEVKVISPEEEITARPNDKVKIEFEARDDFGIASADLIVTQRTPTNSVAKVIPVPLGNEAGLKALRKEIELDLSRFNLKQDEELSYVVQVTDTKQNLAAGSLSDSQNRHQLAQQSGESEASSEQTQQNSQQPNQSPRSEDSQQDPALRPDQQQHIAMKSPAPSEPRDPGDGSQQPPNDMSRRALDAGQCSACQPMKIVVDEWGRSFEGQQREKLEIAIDPVLQKLEQLLREAQSLTDTTLAAGRSSEGFTAGHQKPVDDAKGNLRESDTAVTELRMKTDGTPYAFIGLQLHDIRNSHISPARNGLTAVTLEAEPEQQKEDIRNLETASFEIARAREKLANLTKQYAAVKRDYKIADAMQRLQKMHQIFLEDTQAMLGSSKPVLNPQERKIAEVDDAYAEKLRKLLEEQKKILAELAKILAEDPRLLRRFLALQELDGTSLRDQMTLLTQRQQASAQDVIRWMAATESNRPALLQEFIAAQAAEQTEIAELAAKLHENINTWLPLDVPPELDAVVECQTIAADIGRLSSESAERIAGTNSVAGVESAMRSLEKLRSLDARLPAIEVSWPKSERLTAFVANRMNETADLITRQSGWIKKIEALQSGDFAQAAEVEQHRLTLDTTTLSEKLDAAAASFRQISDEIEAKTDELTGTVHERILPEQTGATAALGEKAVPDANAHQTNAIAAFAVAETQFDELLRLIIAKLDEAPPPDDPGGAKSLEDLLAMLEDEKKAAEGLGVPCRPINVSVMKDWMRPGSGRMAGSGMAQQARSAQAQARQATQRAERVRNQAIQRAKEVAGAETPDGPRTGPRRPGRSWNTLVSQLGEELRQGRDNVPPEQYRQAIEQYFNTISERMPAPTAAPETPPQ